MKGTTQELNVFSVPGLGAIEPGEKAGVHYFCLTMDAASIDEVIADVR